MERYREIMGAKLSRMHTRPDEHMPTTTVDISSNDPSPDFSWGGFGGGGLGWCVCGVGWFTFAL
ncbi:hypothetical protein GCM10009621_13350 [Corynebacterium felinum]